jgi:hypothetical protein
MLKAFTLVSVLLLSFIGGLENPSYLQLMIVFMISAGVKLCAVGESRFSFFGFFLQSAVILSESLRLVLADRFLKNLKVDALSTLYCIAPPSFTIITIGFFIFEFNQFPLEGLCSPFAGILLLNGIASFTLNVRQSQNQNQRHAFLSLRVPL